MMRMAILAFGLIIIFLVYSNWFDYVFYRNSKTKLLMKELEKNKHIDKTILINIFGNNFEKENDGHDHGNEKHPVEIMKAENTLQEIVKSCPCTDVKSCPGTDVKSCSRTDVNSRPGTDKFKSKVLKTISNYIEDQFGSERLLELLKNPGETGKCVLHEAAENKHTLCCSFLINKHGKELLKIKDKRSRGYTPIHYMVGGKFKNGLDETFKLCSKEDTKFLLEQKDKSNNTPVHIAARKGFDNILKSLLDKGGKSDSKNKRGYTPLHLAAQNGHEKCIDILLQNEKNEGLKTFVNDEDNQGITALMLAARQGFDNSCKKLIHHSDLNLKHLDLAAQNGHEKCIDILLQNKISEGLKTFVNDEDNQGITALMLAARQGFDNSCKKLIHHSDLNLKHLDLAAQNGHEKCIDILLQNKISERLKTFVNDEDNQGITALMLAARQGFDNSCKKLIHHSDLNLKHLDLAAQNGHEKCIDILLQNKISERLKTFVNDEDNQGITALMLAARQGFDNSCKKLIHHSDLNLKDKSGKTVLHFAVKSGGIRTFKLLFEEGAKNSAKNCQDKTLLFLAAKHEGIEILEYLFEQMKISLSEFADLLWITVNNKCNDTLKYLLRILENKNCSVKEEVTDGAIQNILKEPREGNTILHKVISKKWFTAATIIIKLCPELKFKRNKKGEYPLHLVSKISSNISGTDKVKKYEDLLTALTQGSHNIVNKFNPEGKSYSHLCAEFGNTSLISRLFKRGCDLTINNRQGESAIEIAAKFSNNDTLEEIMRLLDKGEKEKLKGKLRKALKISAQKGNLEGVKILMSYLQVTAKDQILTN